MDDVLALLHRGLSTRQAAKQVGVSKSMVSKVRKRQLQDTETSRGGRPSLLSTNQKRLIVRKITSGEYDTATEAKMMLSEEQNIKVHVNTVRNALREVGMKGVAKQKKPLLASRHIKARLEFAHKYKDWTVDDWKRVVWSDETKINRFGSDGRKWCWRKPGSALKSNHVQATVKFGGGGLMVWGCMTSQGVGFACRIEGRMNAELYTDILGDEFLETLEYYGLQASEVIFQQDKDSKHTSRRATRWFEDNGIEVLDWPAQSPDLNPIEHLWDHIKRRLSNYERVPTSMHELWNRVEVEWNSIPVEECTKLIESMPRRIVAVLKAKGGHTKY